MSKDSDKPVVLVDMDGVLADFDAELIARIKGLHPHVPLLQSQQSFYFSQDYPEHEKLIRDISDAEGFFRDLPLIEHALEGWQRIIDLGYHPRICSSPKLTNPYSESEKIMWLKQHMVPIFGQSVVDEAFITRDKHLCDGIALIDDRPEIRHTDKAPWQHIVFDQPFNRHTSLPRLNGWQDKNLASLLHDAENIYTK